MRREAGRVVFNQVAEIYDEARPAYPDQLIEDLLALSDFPAGGKILEVGCGTGQASQALAAHGGSLLCLEPGPDLAALAQAKLRAYPRAAVEVTPFEEWPLQEQAFDVVVFPSSWKWVEPAVRCAKSAAALKEAGALAVLGNGSHQPEPEVRRELDHLYAKYAPEMASPSPERQANAGRSITEEIGDSGLFAEVVTQEYPWSRRYDTQSYLKLLNTYSGHIALAEERRRALFTAIADLIEKHGGAVARFSVATLHVARKRRG